MFVNAVETFINEDKNNVYKLLCKLNITAFFFLAVVNFVSSHKAADWH